MDLGIAGKWALVCAASKGLGKGCALALAHEGVAVTLVARTREALDATADEIRRATGSKVTVVAADITTPAGRAQAFYTDGKPASCHTYYSCQVVEQAGRALRVGAQGSIAKSKGPDVLLQSVRRLLQP